MSQSIVVRDKSIAITDEEKSIARKVIFKALRGVDDQNHKRWVLFWRKLMGMEHGECAEVGTRMSRSGPAHRYHMAIEQAIFNAQERFDQFEMFRNWTKIGSGHVEWVLGAKGGIVPLPKSISYASMEEAEFREFHAAFLTFVRGEYCAPYLWKHLPAGKAHEMMESVLAGFDR